MTVDLDTFLVAVYTLVDEVYQAQIAPHKPHRRGHRPELADSEVLTLMLLGQWLGTSERGMLRHAAVHWRAYFPRLLSQSAFNRRARDLGGACTTLGLEIAQKLGAAQTPYQVVDTVPVPLARLCRGKRRRLFGADASIGRGGSDRHFYYGCQLLVATTADGVITGWLVGPASTEGRWLLDALLCWRANPVGQPWTVADLPTSRKRPQGYVGPTGPRWWSDSVGDLSPAPYIADDGFCGTAWVAHWRTDDAAIVFTCADYGEATPNPVHTAHHAWRHGIETVNAILDQPLHLAYPGARTMWGLVTRLAAKCAAFNCGRWLNRHFARPALALTTLFPG